MFIENAYARRDSLTDGELERLLAALKDKAERYRYAIRNYPPDRIDRHGRPFLAGLDEQLKEVEHIIAERTKRPA